MLSKILKVKTQINEEQTSVFIAAELGPDGNQRSQHGNEAGLGSDCLLANVNSEQLINDKVFFFKGSAHLLCRFL